MHIDTVSSHMWRFFMIIRAIGGYHVERVEYKWQLIWFSVLILQGIGPLQKRVVSLAFDLVSNILETGPVSVFPDLSNRARRMKIVTCMSDRCNKSSCVLYRRGWNEVNNIKNFCIQIFFRWFIIIFMMTTDLTRTVCPGWTCRAGG